MVYGLDQRLSHHGKGSDQRALKDLMCKYFSLTALTVMVILTVSLSVLPLVLPPLPPPPYMLLFVPVLIMALLVFLAFSPSKAPNVPSTGGGGVELKDGGSEEKYGTMSSFSFERDYNIFAVTGVELFQLAFNRNRRSLKRINLKMSTLSEGGSQRIDSQTTGIASASGAVSVSASASDSISIYGFSDVVMEDAFNEPVEGDAMEDSESIVPEVITISDTSNEETSPEEKELIQNLQLQSMTPSAVTFFQSSTI
ncbi:hypothetical protein RJ639_011456 [Escallonia herrerae]|uniref:Uncharacterized protein n=1 Tax=Escallonia herrerae TaxID=1293975 RepID=A0AA88VMA3_9ASTE|nr:hypothetical protein RJ639_011456 [Escallonia herrerae]